MFGLGGAVEPGWTWQPADTHALLLSCIIGTIGFLCALALLGASILEQRWRQGDKDIPTEASLLVGCHDEMKNQGKTWRIIFLVVVGLSPLFCCFFVGETFHNVLFAMVGMHWICMLVLPALYYALRSHEDASFGSAAVNFYKDLWSRSCRDCFWKTIRGFLLGAPLFVFFIAGYVLFRCKMFSWQMCMRKFEGPLEDAGFAMHSLTFRMLAALYFTFWNPLIEEFFWRVFLHRELSSELGFQAKLSSEASQCPWQILWSGLVQVIPSCSVDETAWASARVCWGVSLLYASYHTWPMKVLFLANEVWWLHIAIGFFFLVCLGRFFVLLRDTPDFGLPAAYALHAWVDAAFAVLCLCRMTWLLG
jgi:hypothetical protein